MFQSLYVYINDCLQFRNVWTGLESMSRELQPLPNLDSIIVRYFAAHRIQCFANESAVAYFVSQRFAGCKTTSVAMSLVENVTIALRPLQCTIHIARAPPERDVSNARLWVRISHLSRCSESSGWHDGMSSVSMCTATVESCEIFLTLQIHLQSTVM